MSEAAEAIADLDEELATGGEDIVLLRGAGTSASRVTCRAKVSGYDASELVGAVTQQDSRIILSPTQIAAAGWPGAGKGPITPQQGDGVRIQGLNKTVQAATAVQVAGQTVRIEMRVRGAAS